MSDIRNGGMVAPRHKKSAKKNKRAAVSSPSVFTEDFDQTEVTETGSTIVKALEQLQEAAATPEGRAKWEAWQILQNEVDGLRRGNVPMPLDLDAQPQLFIAAQAVSVWIDAFAPSYLPNGQKTSGEEGGKS